MNICECDRREKDVAAELTSSNGEVVIHSLVLDDREALIERHAGGFKMLGPLGWSCS